MFTGNAFEPRTLCMRDGRFVATPPADERVETIDAEGRFLLPPFAEAHTHTFYGGDGSKSTSRNLLDPGVFYAFSANNPNAVVATA